MDARNVGQGSRVGYGRNRMNLDELGFPSMLSRGPSDPESLPPGLHFSPDDAGKMGIHFETGLVLCSMVESRRPEYIVEVGSHRGYSTSWLILGTVLNQFGRVDAFEVTRESSIGPMWYDIFNLPKDRFKFHSIPLGLWDYTEELPARIDFCFHDTFHLSVPTEKELDVIVPRIPVGGIIIFDDMRQACWTEYQHVIRCRFGFSAEWDYFRFPFGHEMAMATRLR